MQNKKYVSALLALATITTLATAVPVFAQTTTPQGTPPVWANRGAGNGANRIMKPGVYGKVTAVSGNIITVSSMKRTPGATATTAPTPIAVTYTVDATNAKIMKNNVAGTIASIAVGDTIMAQGTLTGTNLVATTIRDGVMMRGIGKTGTGT